MKAVIAMDSFKGSLTSMEAGNTVRQAFLDELGQEAFVYPIADGGEGTVEAVLQALHGSRIAVEVTGPLGDKVEAFYGIVNEGKTAIIEMAAASGLPLVPENLRNPMNTTTYGVGELIRDALDRGVRSFVIGIGGSATNDGGLGMLSALGMEFWNEKGMPCGMFGRDLATIHKVDPGKLDSRLAYCDFRVACDVTNPLCGPGGASAVFGPQKGADAVMIQALDEALLHYAELSEAVMGKEIKNTPGAGAAGGLGFALLAFLNAELLPGIELVLDLLQVEENMKTADLVITGEGRIDGQTAMGKAPVGVAVRAKKYGLPVIAFAGCIGEGAEKCNEKGIDAYFPITRSIVSLEEALDPKTAGNNLYRTAVQVFRLMKGLRFSGQ